MQWKDLKARLLAVGQAHLTENQQRSISPDLLQDLVQVVAVRFFLPWEAIASNWHLTR